MLLQRRDHGACRWNQAALLGQQHQTERAGERNAQHFGATAARAIVDDCNRAGVRKCMGKNRRLSCSQVPRLNQ